MGKLTEAQIQEICRRYQAGESSSELGEAFGVDKSTICRYLRVKGIARRSISEANRQYTVEHAFFSVINTQARAYVLGFVAADGHIHRKSLEITLQRRDRQHLHRLLQAMRSDYPIYDVKGHGYKNGGRYSRIYIRSAQFASDLQKHGIVSGKGFTLRWPACLQPDMLRHYLRGFVDANGGFYVYTYPPKGARLSFSVCSNRAWLKGAQTYLMAQCTLRRTKLNIKIRHPSKPDIGYLQYGGNLQVSRIFHLLYDGATIWLPRKRDKVEPYIE